MKFPYTEYEIEKGKFIARPTLPVVLKYGKIEIPIRDALVDTGADETLLPLDFALAFGFLFNLEKDGMECAGAGGGKFRVFPSPKPIQFILRQDGYRDLKWSGSVTFTLSQPTILLGHKGCLEHLDLTFLGRKKVLEVNGA